MTFGRSSIAVLVTCVALLSGCARYSPDEETHITAKQARYSGPAEAVAKVLDKDQINSALDYDVEDVPLAAVSVRIHNRGVLPLQLDYLRTRLVDGRLAYGLVPTEVAILRTERTGFWKAQWWMRTFGLMGYIYSRKQINRTNNHLRRDFEIKGVPEKPIIPNATLRGVLFFQIDAEAAEDYDATRYGVVLSFVSPGDPPVIEIHFPPEKVIANTPREDPNAD
jgi:hypothetical protein